MHMADALVSPTVGVAMLAVSAIAVSTASAKIKSATDDRKTALMGVMGAFIFAAQMINFSIPMTGSSGHIGGGLLLSILLGPSAALLVISSILVVQALFFADGGLLAVGCNIFNMGVVPSFIIYPLVYKSILGNSINKTRRSIAILVSAVGCLQLGAFSVVLESVISGVTDLPFATFTTMMLPIHLAIGVAEGLVTTATVAFIYKAKPEILMMTRAKKNIAGYSIRSLLISFLFAAILAAGVGSWFASKKPDGLEWSIAKITGNMEVANQKSKTHQLMAFVQKQTAFLADYQFGQNQTKVEYTNKENHVNRGISAIIGGLVTLLILLGCGFLIKNRDVK